MITASTSALNDHNYSKEMDPGENPEDAQCGQPIPDQKAKNKILNDLKKAFDSQRVEITMVQYNLPENCKKPPIRPSRLFDCLVCERKKWERATGIKMNICLGCGNFAELWLPKSLSPICVDYLRSDRRVQLDFDYKCRTCRFRRLVENNYRGWWTRKSDLLALDKVERKRYEKIAAFQVLIMNTPTDITPGSYRFLNVRGPGEAGNEVVVVDAKWSVTRCAEASIRQFDLCRLGHEAWATPYQLLSEGKAEILIQNQEIGKSVTFNENGFSYVQLKIG